MKFTFDPNFFEKVTKEEFIKLHPELKNAGEIYDQNAPKKVKETAGKG